MINASSFLDYLDDFCEIVLRQYNLPIPLIVDWVDQYGECGEESPIYYHGVTYIFECVVGPPVEYYNMRDVEIIRLPVSITEVTFYDFLEYILVRSIDKSYDNAGDFLMEKINEWY